MKTLTVIFVLATVIFAAPALADHNERDALGRKHGHWTEFLEDENDENVLVADEGHYVNGKRHGPWVLRNADGDVFEGPYVDGKWHGQWVFRWADGSVHEGPYVDNKRHGHWVERDADGVVEEEGPFVDNKRHGYWVEREPDGYGFAGRYEEGGLFFGSLPDEVVLEGPFVDGRRHGKWVARLPDGTVVNFTYRNGELIDVK